jgi:predicted nucleotidyltransferase
MRGCDRCSSYNSDEDLVTELVQIHRAALSDLCRRYGVKRLYLFGSGVSDRLQPSSDLDFLVEMAEDPREEAPV